MSGPAASPAPRIFVSHSHEDDEYCRAFVDELRRLCGEREAVWYDEHNLTSGELLREIQRHLHQRPIFVVIFTKASLDLRRSQWVADECTWAYQLYRAEPGRTILPVVGGPIERGDFIPDWLYLEGFRRIEAPGMRPYPPAEAARRTYAALTGAQTAVAPAQAVMPGKPEPQPASRSAPVGAPASTAPTRQAVSAPPAHLPGHHAPAPVQRAVPTPARPVLPRERFPEWLERLGFVAEMGRDPNTGKEVAYIRPPLCPVPAGPFLMGSVPWQDSQARDSEKPQITVDLPAYQIGRYPVTVAEYACFVAAGHAEPQQGYLGTDWQTQLQRLDHPVTCVNWKDARDYATWLARLTGQPWKLPSEAEWEKAARWDPKGNGGRGVARMYPWDDSIRWLVPFDRARCNTRESQPKIGTTTAVGTYGPENPSRDGSSPCGAQDMAGNVWEWTRTIYDAQAYGKKAFKEDINSTENRVLRGGSWYSYSSFARAAYRDSNRPDVVVDDIGFRVVLLSAR